MGNHYMNRVFRKFRQAIRALYASTTNEGVRSLIFKLDKAEQELASLEKILGQADNRNKALDIKELQALTTKDLGLQLGLATGQAVNLQKSYKSLASFLSQEINLNSNAMKIVRDKKIDFVIGHDILGLAAASSLSKHFDCKLIVDLVEEYDVLKRTGSFFRRNFNHSEASFLNNMIEALILNASDFIQIGPTQLENFSGKFRRPSKFLPNFRNEYLAPESIIRTADEICQEASIYKNGFICVPNRIILSEDINLLAGGIAKLGLNLPIVHLGPPLAQKVKFEVQSFCKESDVKFIELGNLDYNLYREILSRARFCSFITNNEIYNVKYAFPNRLFDAISTHTPILTSGYVQVGEFVDEQNIGVYFDQNPGTDDVADMISSMEAQRDIFKRKLNLCSKECSWDNVFDSAFKHIGDGARILIVTRKDVRSNQRIHNFRRSFIKKGCDVIVISGHRDEYGVMEEDFYTVPLKRVLLETEIHEQ